MRNFNENIGRYPAGCVYRLLLLAVVLGPVTAFANSITVPDADGDVGRFTSLVLDNAGYPVVVYHDLTNRDLKLLHCDDSGCAGDESGNIATPDAAGMIGTYTSMRLDAAGNPVISYYDSSKGDLKLLHCDDPRCDGDESSNIAVPDAFDIFGMYSSLALDAAGNPVVSYYDFSNGNLKLLHCDDPKCVGDESGNLSAPDTEGDVGLYTFLVLDAVGNPVVSYYDSSKGSLKLLHCDDPNCRGDESGNIATPDAGDVGWYSSLVLDAIGNPVVSYYDTSKGDLKLLHCDDSNCRGNESAHVAVPDAAGTVGSYISMALDSASNPVISYYDSSNGDLKLLHCDDPGCAGDEAGNISIPDAEGDVGLYSSLALDAAGNPVISYYDLSHQDLKLLHCTDPYCKNKQR